MDSPSPMILKGRLGAFLNDVVMFRKQFQKEIWGNASEELGLVLPLNPSWAFAYLLWWLGGSQTTSAQPCPPLPWP